jgi:phage tail sheath protein FI
MPEYLAPGVYVEEIEIGAKPIEGVSTSTAGLIGETERGPVAPKLVTSLVQFQRVYGDYFSDSFLPYAVSGFFSNGGKRCFISRIVGKGAQYATLEALSPQEKPTKKEDEKNPSTAFTVNAVGPGAWGNRVAIKIDDASLSVQNPKLFKLTVVYWKENPPKPVVDPTDLTKQKDLNRREPALVDVYDNLSPDPTSSDNYEKRINDISVLIKLSRVGDERPGNMKLTLLQDGKEGVSVNLEDYKGTSSDGNGTPTGLFAFGKVDEISILVAPNENDIKGLTGVLVEHCELMKDRFAVLQAKQNAGPIGNLLPPSDSKYAAYYYPWIKIIDPITQNEKLIPPAGHIAGIYTRSDTERGVHKAPANEVVRGIVGIQFPITKGDQEILNPRGVNCIRNFRSRGARVWGARTISSDPLWKYLNVRRLFLYLEESIEEGTQWVVFEPNDEKLWARVKQTITQFLTRVWKDGALMGTTAEEAFFVKCDRTTMTQDDIDNGRLIVLIGVAPVKPAEFVIFRIAQWQGGSEVRE